MWNLMFCFLRYEYLYEYDWLWFSTHDNYSTVQKRVSFRGKRTASTRVPWVRHVGFLRSRLAIALPSSKEWTTRAECTPTNREGTWRNQIDCHLSFQDGWGGDWQWAFWISSRKSVSQLLIYIASLDYQGVTLVYSLCHIEYMGTSNFHTNNSGSFLHWYLVCGLCHHLWHAVAS